MVNHSRWRQVPFAQEQTLSSVFVSDNTEDQGFVESQIVAKKDLPILLNANVAEEGQADVALIWDYTA